MVRRIGAKGRAALKDLRNVEKEAKKDVRFGIDLHKEKKGDKLFERSTLFRKKKKL